MNPHRRGSLKSHGHKITQIDYHAHEDYGYVCISLASQYNFSKFMSQTFIYNYDRKEFQCSLNLKHM